MLYTIPYMKAVVISAAATLMLCGCHTARDVAVTSFRVIDAPAAFVRRKIDPRDQTTTTTTVTSDRVTPGRPVDLPPERPPVAQRRIATETRSGDRSQPGATPRTSPRSASNDAAPRSSATPGSRGAANQQSQFPTAKPVPGKPGYVFSPFDPSGGYVDVTGYASGSKAKDPYSQKVFIVP